MDNFREVSEKGTFHNAQPQGFQEGYYPTVTEAKAFWKEMGLIDIEIISTRTFMHQNESHILHIKHRDPALFEAILEAHRIYAKREAFVEAGGHALVVGKRPD